MLSPHYWLLLVLFLGYPRDLDINSTEVHKLTLPSPFKGLNETQSALCRYLMQPAHFWWEPGAQMHTQQVLAHTRSEPSALACVPRFPSAKQTPNHG